MEHAGIQEEPWDPAMASTAAVRSPTVSCASSSPHGDRLCLRSRSSVLIAALCSCLLHFVLWKRIHCVGQRPHVCPGRPQIPGHAAWVINSGGRCCRSARAGSPQRHCVNGQAHQRVSPFHLAAPSRRLRSISSKDNMGENSNNLTVWSRASAPSGRSGGS